MRNTQDRLVGLDMLMISMVHVVGWPGCKANCEDLSKTQGLAFLPFSWAMPTITVFRQDSQARVEPQHKTSYFYLVDSLETVKQVFDGETSAPRWFTPSPPWLNSDSGDDGVMTVGLLCNRPHAAVCLMLKPSPYPHPISIYHIWVKQITTSLFSLTGIMVNKGNHPQMALIQVSELL